MYELHVEWNAYASSLFPRKDRKEDKKQQTFIIHKNNLRNFYTSLELDMFGIIV